MATTKECGLSRLIYISKTQKHKYLIVTKDKCEFFFIRLTDDLADKITIHQISPEKILKSVPDLILYHGMFKKDKYMVEKSNDEATYQRWVRQMLQIVS